MWALPPSDGSGNGWQRGLANFGWCVTANKRRKEKGKINRKVREKKRKQGKKSREERGERKEKAKKARKSKCNKC